MAEHDHPRMYRISLACNDTSGNFAGRVEAIQVDDLLQLEGDPLRLALGVRTIIEGLDVRAHGYIQWLGNIMWDAIRLDEHDTARLLEHLRRKHWTVIEGDAALFHAYEDGMADMAAALQKARAH